MYKWLDQAFATLDVRSRLLVWAMRRWWQDNAAGGCGCLHVGPAFHCYGLLAALPDFQITMLSLRDALIETFQPGSDAVSEHEAFVLALLDGCAREADYDQWLHETLQGNVREGGVDRLAVSLRGLAGKFPPAGLQAPLTNKENRTS